MADAGWLSDPLGTHELRYWDGSAWTEHVSDQGATSVSPLPADAPAPPPPAPAMAPPPPPSAPATGGKGGWKDKLKSAATQAAEQGKKLGEQAKGAVAEQQAKRTEQLKNDPNTLWFGQSVDVTSKATGMSKATYRITKDRVWIDTGLLGTKSESVPLWAVRDMDVRQNVMQRGKDIGDVVLWLEDPAYSVNQGGAFDTGFGASELLPDSSNEHEPTPGVNTVSEPSAAHSPAVLGGVKGLRFAPVLVDGLRPPLTPPARRRNWQRGRQWPSPPIVTSASPSQSTLNTSRVSRAARSPSTTSKARTRCGTC